MHNAFGESYVRGLFFSQFRFGCTINFLHNALGESYKRGCLFLKSRRGGYVFADSCVSGRLKGVERKEPRAGWGQTLELTMLTKRLFSVSTFVFVSKALEMTILTKRLGLLWFIPKTLEMTLLTTSLFLWNEWKTRISNGKIPSMYYMCSFLLVQILI